MEARPVRGGCGSVVLGLSTAWCCKGWLSGVQPWVRATLGPGEIGALTGTDQRIMEGKSVLPWDDEGSGHGGVSAQ